MRLRREHYIIFTIQVTEVLGFSLILPFLPFFAQDYGASPLVVGLIFASFSFFQFFSAPIMGRLSDFYGRKPMLILSQLSTFAGFIILGLSTNLWMIFASRIVDGLFGSNWTIAQAYLSDISTREERSQAFGLSGMAFGFGFLIGPAMGGYLSQYGYHIPSFVAAAVSLLTVFLTIFFLKETVHRKEIRNADFKIIDLAQVRSYFSNKKTSVKLWQFLAFIMAHVTWVTSFALYAERQIGFNAQDIGYALTYVGVISILFRGVLLGKMIRYFGEQKLRFIGAVSMVVGLLISAFITEGWMFFPVITFFAFGAGVMRPLTMGSISKSVSEDEQGAVIGVANSLGSIAQIFAPILGGLLIHYLFPGSLGLVSAAIMMIAVLMLVKEQKAGFEKASGAVRIE